MILFKFRIVCPKSLSNAEQKRRWTGKNRDAEKEADRICKANARSKLTSKEKKQDKEKTKSTKQTLD